MAKVPKGKRTANYTKEECWRLVELVENYAHILENKKNDALAWKDKKNTWQNICNRFNSCGTENRTWEQLRSKYETLKKETRRAVTKSQTESDGGPADGKLNPLYEKIETLIALNCDGTSSHFDDDYCDGRNLDPISDTDTPTSTKTDARFTISAINDNESNTEGIQTKMETFSDCEDDVEASNTEVNWGSYSPPQLKKRNNSTPQVRKIKTNNSEYISVSTAEREMHSWLDAKAELMNLKLKLLRQEFNVKQQQQQELHQQQLQLNNQKIEINKLTIQKLKLEIEKLRK